MLARLDAAQRERHAQEWRALDEAYQGEREAILDWQPTAKAIISEQCKERQAMATAQETTQAREMAALDRKSRSLIGRFQTALDAAREVCEPERGGLPACPADDWLCPLAGGRQGESRRQAAGRA